MARETYTVGDAAHALGISIDTLRRWDRAGRIQTDRDSRNRRIVPASEVERLRGAGRSESSARNRFHGVVREVTIDGLLAEVEIAVSEPTHVVAIITRESAERLGLRVGAPATAVVKATSVMVQQ